MSKARPLGASLLASVLVCQRKFCKQRRLAPLLSSLTCHCLPFSPFTVSVQHFTFNHCLLLLLYALELVIRISLSCHQMFQDGFELSIIAGFCSLVSYLCIIGKVTLGEFLWFSGECQKVNV